MNSDVWPHLAHAERRSVVLPGRRVYYLPMPKSGCTSMLWALARVAGCKPAQFHGSLSGQVTPAMTVHDMSRWRDRFKWVELSRGRRRQIAADPSWMRFTTVRDPARRLWSAWQSKLLVREPDYAAAFGPDRWFPRLPRDPGDIVSDFRAFVRALDGGPRSRPSDAHWAPQTQVLATAPPLTHIGRIEGVDDIVATLRGHVGGRVASRIYLDRDNSGILPYSPGLYDAECARIVNRIYAADLEAFGYSPVVPDSSLDDWTSRVESLLPLLRGLIERHTRMATLLRTAHGRHTRPTTDIEEGGVLTHAVHQ